MPTVSVTIALKKEPSIKCDLSVSRDSQGNRTWRRFGWSKGGLVFDSSFGKWNYYAPLQELHIFDNEGTIFATATKVRGDLLTYVTCGRSFVTDGDAWNNGTYRDATFNFSFACV